jgi:hypothetical protein
VPDPSPDVPDPTAATAPTGVVATGVGSWPGTDVREALRVVRGELAGAVPDGVTGMPYLPELPDRGPGSDLVGRATHLLVDLPVDLQPQGWRLVDRPGRDSERTASLWRQDLDELAEAFDGYHGMLKVQVAGPWTLAASVWLPLGDRVLSDVGATRDLAGSLAEGVAAHVGAVRRLVPGAQVVVQVDEPSLTAVALGRIRSESGYRVLRAPEPGDLATALEGVVDAARGAGAVLVATHSCAPDVPLGVLRRAGVDAVNLDVSLLGTNGWEQVAELVESGVRLWAGALPTQVLPAGPSSGAAPAAAQARGQARGPDGGRANPTIYPERVEELVRRWRQLGLPPADLARVAVTPACGLAGASPDQARALSGATLDAAARLAEAATA